MTKGKVACVSMCTSTGTRVLLLQKTQICRGNYQCPESMQKRSIHWVEIMSLLRWSDVKNWPVQRLEWRCKPFGKQGTIMQLLYPHPLTIHTHSLSCYCIHTHSLSCHCIHTHSLWTRCTAAADVLQQMPRSRSFRFPHSTLTAACWVAGSAGQIHLLQLPRVCGMQLWYVWNAATRSCYFESSHTKHRKSRMHFKGNMKNAPFSISCQPSEKIIVQHCLQIKFHTLVAHLFYKQCFPCSWGSVEQEVTRGLT